MNSGLSRFPASKFVALLLSVPLLAGSVSAQVSSGTLRGHVTDPSGAVITQAIIKATSASGQAVTATTNNQGTYEIKGLLPGNYKVSALAKGFAAFTSQEVAVTAGDVKQFDIALEIEVQPEKVEVQDESNKVDVSSSNNASSLVIKGKDLEALSDDPDELQSDLEALAGPSAGPNGGQIYIDGFTGGQLPPKSSIREIRINQNPFSAEYDKLGYGRIEILTKPGTDKFHGQFMVHGNDSAFNSLNPFVTAVPPYHSVLFDGNVGGPLSKKASFFFDAERRNISDASVVDATILDANFNPVQFTQAVPVSRTRTEINPRFDFQLGPNNTLTVRYEFFQNNQNNQGIGQFSLASQAYNSDSTEHTLQISDTQVLSTNVVNETRFEYERDTNSQTVQNFQPTVSVSGAFTDGGNSTGNGTSTTNHYELQNYTSMVHGKHFIKFGGRLRTTADSDISTADFNGVFTFPSLTAYQTTVIGLQHGLTPAQSRTACQATSSNPTTDCGASQFSIITGLPLAQVTLVDVGLYGEDDWRIRPNLTLSYGLRFETQNQIHDHGDFAPRVAVAWGLGAGKSASPKTVLRAGFGMFYDRFPSDLVLQAERLNGVTQQQTIVTNPDFFPNIPTGSIPGAQTSPTVYQIAPNLRAPYVMQSAVSIERQLTKKATVSVTYVNSLGEHQLFIRNINAPLPGTFNPNDPTSGVRPFGGTTNIYQYESEGIFRQNQVIANVRVNAGARLSLFSFYTLNYANSDLGAASGGGGFFSGGPSGGANFLSNQYNPMADYGRAAFDVRHRIFLGGTISLPYAFRVSPFVVASSGQPFNITVGQDLNGDSIFNDRPALLSSATCPAKTSQAAIVCTPLGTFNTLPTSGTALIPVNDGTGPTLFTVNLRLSKTFGFGRETGGPAGAAGGPGGHGRGGPGGGLGGRGLGGGGGPGGGGLFGMGPATNHRYSLTFGVSARNVLNRVNFAPPVGNLNSPLFDQSNALAGGIFSQGSANRRIDLQAVFSF